MSAVGFLTVMVVAFTASADDSANWTILQEAETAFREGCRLREHPEQARKQFRAAAERYEVLRARGIRNADLFHNEGNAYLLAGDLPRAILSYRRGLRLAPHDAGLHSDLEAARGQVVYLSGAEFGRPAPEHWPPWLPRPSARTGWWLAALAYGAGWAALTRWLMVRRRGLLAVSALGFALALLSVVVPVVDELNVRDELARPVVVLSEDGVLLRKGNGPSYPPRSEVLLNPGVEARLVHTRGAWLQIELASGEVGWVPQQYAIVDEPGS